MSNSTFLILAQNSYSVIFYVQPLYFCQCFFVLLDLRLYMNIVIYYYVKISNIVKRYVNKKPIFQTDAKKRNKFV